MPDIEDDDVLSLTPEGEAEASRQKLKGLSEKVSDSQPFTTLEAEWLLNEVERLGALATSVSNPTDANRYHQALGAKWMCEAIVRFLRSTTRPYWSAHRLASMIEPRWQDSDFWGRKIWPVETIREAWFIERTDTQLCMSIGPGRQWVTFTDQTAWRFKTRPEAEKEIAARKLPDVRATEHRWLDGPK